MRISPIITSTPKITFGKILSSEEKKRKLKHDQFMLAKKYSNPAWVRENDQIITKFKEMGCQIRADLSHPDYVTYNISSDKEIELTAREINDARIRRFEGDLTITDLNLPKDTVIGLSEVTGKLTIKDNSTTPSNDPIEFIRLRQVGSMDIVDNNHVLEFYKLERIRGDFKTSGFIRMPFVQSIDGDFNVNGNSQIDIAAITVVKGKINNNPPKEDTSVFIYKKDDEDPKKTNLFDVLEFKNNGNIKANSKYLKYKLKLQ